jgi:hypothetical protein
VDGLSAGYTRGLTFHRLFPALFCCFGAFAASHTTWREYGGAPDAAQYSALKQINRSIAQM